LILRTLILSLKLYKQFNRDEVDAGDNVKNKGISCLGFNQ
jgi:hypothetical protein